MNQQSFYEDGSRVLKPDAFEFVLAAELNIGTVNLSFVTDADAGLAPALADTADTADPDAVSAGLVFTRLRAAQPRILAAIDGILRALPEDFTPRRLIAPEQVGAVLDRKPVPAPAAPAGAEA